MKAREGRDLQEQDSVYDSLSAERHAKNCALSLGCNRLSILLKVLWFRQSRNR